MAECVEDGQQVTFSGYEVELFRRVADRMTSSFNDTDFTVGEWEFSCVDWDTLTLDLYKPASDPQRHCDISFGLIDASAGRMLQGAQFSSPTYLDSLQLLVLNPVTKVDRWAFLAPFKPELWLALFGSSAAVSASIWLQEVHWKKIITHPKQALEKLSNLQWASLALLLQVLAKFSARRIGARLTILGFGFMVLITINTYMAVLAARLTVKTFRHEFGGLQELADQPVGVFEDYVENIREHTPLLNLVPLPWNSLEDEQEMLRKLRAGEIVALLQDSPWVQYQAASNCDLTVLKQQQAVLPFNVAFGFPVDFPRDKLTNINMALAQLMEEGILTALENEYIRPAAACSSKNTQLDLANVQLTFNQLSGLWIFLGAAAALGWVLDLAQAAVKCCRARRLPHPHAVIVPAQGGLGTASELGDRNNSDYGLASSGSHDASLAKPYCAGTPRVYQLPSKASNSYGDRWEASESSVSGVEAAVSGDAWERSRRSSFLRRQDRADSRMAVGDASTVEEMVELLGAQVRHMDWRLRRELPALEHRVELSQQAILAAIEAAAAAVRAAGDGAGDGCMRLAAFDEGSQQLLQAIATGGEGARTRASSSASDICGNGGRGGAGVPAPTKGADDGADGGCVATAGGWTRPCASVPLSPAGAELNGDTINRQLAAVSTAFDSSQRFGVSGSFGGYQRSQDAARGATYDNRHSTPAAVVRFQLDGYSGRGAAGQRRISPMVAARTSGGQASKG